jgi:hypothetical protein
MTVSSQFVGYRKGNSSKPKDIISALEPFILQALEHSQADGLGEVVVFFQRKTSDISVEVKGSDRHKLSLHDMAKIPGRSKLLEGWEEQRQAELQKTLAYCQQIFPGLMDSLEKKRSLVSIQSSLKFRGGRFVWSTETVESSF